MLALITSILPALATAAITAYNKSKDVTIASYQAAASIAAAQSDYMKAVLGHPLSPPSIMCYAVAIWFFKAVVVDKLIAPALGYNWSTDPLTGGTQEIAMLVVSGMFLAGVVNIIRR